MTVFLSRVNSDESAPKKDAASYLDNNDSYNYFKGDHETHFKIGHTGTNVMDIQVLLFETTSLDSSGAPLSRL